MHRLAEAPADAAAPVFPSGFVVANESDGKRAKLFLAGRVRKLATPCCGITVGQGQSLPLAAFGGTFDRVREETRRRGKDGKGLDTPSLPASAAAD